MYCCLQNANPRVIAVVIYDVIDSYLRISSVRGSTSSSIDALGSLLLQFDLHHTHGEVNIVRCRILSSARELFFLGKIVYLPTLQRAESRVLV